MPTTLLEMHPEQYSAPLLPDITSLSYYILLPLSILAFISIYSLLRLDSGLDRLEFAIPCQLHL